MINQAEVSNFEDKIAKIYPHHTSSFSINSKSKQEVLNLYVMEISEFLLKCEYYRDFPLENKKYVIERSIFLQDDQENFNVIINIKK